MMTPEDRASVDNVIDLARYRDQAKPDLYPANDLGFAVTPEEVAALAQIVGQLQSIGKNPGKERYKQIDPQTDKLASIVGLDIVTGSQQIGVSPSTVAQHISYYLKGRGVNLTPDQVLAAAPSSSGPLSTASLQRYLPYVAIGAAAFYFMRSR